MKRIVIILLILTSFILSCNRYDGNVCFSNDYHRSVKVPFLVLDSIILFITNDYYNAQSKVDLPLNNLLIYNSINDSLNIKKTNFIGTPLKIFKNKNEVVVLVTSKCIYTINKNYDIFLENQFNFTENNQKIKTLYDWVDENLIIMPGIDNLEKNIYKINTNDFSFEIFNNSQLNIYKNELVDFIFPKSLSNIDFIFTNGSKYFIVKDNNKIEKSLPDNNQILSLSYNYFDNEICLGSTNGNVYYDDFSQFRKNILKNGNKFPTVSCSPLITAINFENTKFRVFENFNISSSYNYNFSKKNDIATAFYFKNNETEMTIPINIKKDEINGHSSLNIENNNIFLNFYGNYLESFSSKEYNDYDFPNLKLNYNTRTLEIERQGGNITTKIIYYEE